MSGKSGFQGKFIDEQPHFDNDGERRIYIEFFKNLPDNYDKFIENKNDAFNLFCRQKVLIDKNKIQQEDAVQFQKISASRGTLQLGSIICSALGIFYLQKGLRYKNIIYGMTYRFTFLSFLFKFYFMPQFIARGLDEAIFEPQEKSLQKPIIDKYDLQEQEYRDLYFRLKTTQGFTIGQDTNQNINLSQQQQPLYNLQNNNNNINNNTPQQQYSQTDSIKSNFQDNYSSDNNVNSSNDTYNFDNNNSFSSSNEEVSARPQFDNNYGSESSNQKNQDYYKAFRN